VEAPASPGAEATATPRPESPPSPSAADVTSNGDVEEGDGDEPPPQLVWYVLKVQSGREDTIRDALEREYHGSADGWQSARHGRSLREQATLVRRLAAYGPVVLEHRDVAEVRQGLKRLLADIDHHVQRQHDLAYDEVEQEIGGSE